MMNTKTEQKGIFGEIKKINKKRKEISWPNKNKLFKTFFTALFFTAFFVAVFMLADFLGAELMKLFY